MPVLFARSIDDEFVTAIIFIYTCHATVLAKYQWCGDYPIQASLRLNSNKCIQILLQFFFSRLWRRYRPNASIKTILHLRIWERNSSGCGKSYRDDFKVVPSYLK